MGPSVRRIDSLEAGIRLGCGTLFGLFLGAVVALLWLPASWGAWCVVGLTVPVCALLAWRLGDRFWRGLAAILRPIQQLWPPWP